MFGVLVFLIIFYELNYIDIVNKFVGISWFYWLGIDYLGWDVLIWIIYVIRFSLLYVFVVLIIFVVIGVIFGFILGYFLGYIDVIIMCICDVMLVFLSYVVILVLIMLFGMGVENIIIVFILIWWVWFCCVIWISVM